MIAMKEGESASEEEIISFVQERIARYKYPRKVTFMDELPKNATGKILKRELIEVGARSNELERSGLYNTRGKILTRPMNIGIEKEEF